jgi:uncharacterized paraquat-inducible protein A
MIACENLACPACDVAKATEHLDGWNAPVCAKCRAILTKGWERAQKRRGIISLVLISFVLWGLSITNLTEDPAVLAIIVVVILSIVLWDRRTFKNIDRQYFIRRTY